MNWFAISTICILSKCLCLAWKHSNTWNDSLTHANVFKAFHLLREPKQWHFRMKMVWKCLFLLVWMGYNKVMTDCFIIIRDVQYYPRISTVTYKWNIACFRIQYKNHCVSNTIISTCIWITCTPLPHSCNWFLLVFITNSWVEVFWDK